MEVEEEVERGEGEEGEREEREERGEDEQSRGERELEEEEEGAYEMEGGMFTHSLSPQFSFLISFPSHPPSLPSFLLLYRSQ